MFFVNSQQTTSPWKMKAGLDVYKLVLPSSDRCVFVFFFLHDGTSSVSLQLGSKQTVHSCTNSPHPETKNQKGSIIVQFCMQNHCDPEDCFLQTSHFQSATPFNFFLLFAICKDLTRIIFWPYPEAKSGFTKIYELHNLLEAKISVGVTKGTHCIHPEWCYLGN